MICQFAQHDGGLRCVVCGLTLPPDARWNIERLPYHVCVGASASRTPAQIENLAAYCRSTCLDYGEANAELGWKEQCLHGCTMVVRKREKKPLLSQLWERGRCPGNRWPDV